MKIQNEKRKMYHKEFIVLNFSLCREARKTVSTVEPSFFTLHFAI